MRERCPGSRFVSSGTLPGFRFVYDGHSPRRGGAVGNVVPSQGENVEGAVYEITKSDESSLDAYESYPVLYQKKSVRITLPENDGITCMIYFREGEMEGAPTEDYRNIVVNGARDCGIGEDYINTYLTQ